MTESDLTKISNQVKELILEALVSNRYITKKEGKEIKEYYAIVITKKGWLGTAWDKLRGIKEDDGIQINIVRDAHSVETLEKEEVGFTSYTPRGTDEDIELKEDNNEEQNS